MAPLLYGWDTETFLFVPGLAAPRLVVGSWSDGVTDHIGTPEQTRKFFVETLERGDHLAGVNIPYDIVVMAAQWPELLPLIFDAAEAGLFHDCAIREALNDIALGKLVDRGDDDDWHRYSMAVLMLRHFNLDISAEKSGDSYRTKYATLADIPIELWPKEAVDYPKRDARRSRDICVAQRKHRNKHDEPNQVRAAIALQLCRAWGFRTDGEYIDVLEQDVERVWQEARTEFAKAGIYRPNGSQDKKRLGELVSQAYNGEPPMTPGRISRATGKRVPAISTDRDTLLESGVEILEKLGKSGKNDKRKSTYIPALKKGIYAPVNPEFNVLVATGRISSDWQQMPQKGGLREAVLARPGAVIGSLDYGGLELRTMSQRAINDKSVGFSKMADFINEGKDVHCYVAGYFLGCSYEETYTRYKANEPLVVAFRSLAKIFNFGKGGGMGAGAMAYNARTKDGVRFCLLAGRTKVCGEHKEKVKVQGKFKSVCSMCIQVARELGDKWLKAWPEQGMLFEKAGRLTSGKRRVEVTVFGSERVRGDCGYTQWLNTPFQGAGGDGMKRAMWRIAKEMYVDRRSPLFGSRTILNIHDELWIEFPDEPQRRHDAAFRASKIMVDTMNELTPDARNEVEPAIMRRPFKSAGTVYDKQGLLKPWWPPNKGGVWAWANDAEVMAADLAA